MQGTNSRISKLIGTLHNFILYTAFLILLLKLLYGHFGYFLLSNQSDNGERKTYLKMKNLNIEDEH